jgi:hypothetical protein
LRRILDNIRSSSITYIQVSKIKYSKQKGNEMKKHVHKEPSRSFWEEVGMYFFLGSLVAHLLTGMVLIKIYEPSFMPDMVQYALILSAFLGTIVIPIVLVSIRGEKIEYISSSLFSSHSKNTLLLKAYNDGCFEVGMMFWKKGGRVFEIKASSSDFEKENELFKDIAYKFVWREEHVTVTVPIHVQIQTFAFELREYYEKIVIPEKKTFEELAKEVFAAGLDTKKLDEIISSYANEEITKKDLLKQLAKAVSFNESFFSTVTGSKITFGDPVYEACTGTLCPVSTSTKG